MQNTFETVEHNWDTLSLVKKSEKFGNPAILVEVYYALVNIYIYYNLASVEHHNE